MTAMQKLFSGDLISTHMPFFDGTCLLFSHCAGTLQYEFNCGGTIWRSIRANPALAARFSGLKRTQSVVYRPWKLGMCDWTDKRIQPLATGLPSGAIECSPSMYHDGNTVYVSFISGVPGAAGLTYRLHMMSGPDLAHLGAAEPVSSKPTWCGFVSPLHVCRGGGKSLELTEKASGERIRLTTSFQRIVRATFTAEDAANLIVTGIDKANTYRSIVYELETGAVSDIMAEGHVYKSSIHGDQIVCARQRSQAVDDRELLYGTFTLSPSDVSIAKEVVKATLAASVR
jgi:hypothetical protein